MQEQESASADAGGPGVVEAEAIVCSKQQLADAKQSLTPGYDSLIGLLHYFSDPNVHAGDDCIDLLS